MEGIVKHRVLDFHDGLLAIPCCGVDGAEQKRPGGWALGLRPLVPLRNVLLDVRPRDMADTLQPALEPVPQPIVPPVDATPDVAQLLVPLQIQNFSQKSSNFFRK